MFSRGAGRRHEADELRARFEANRDKVRSWQGRWEIPEVEWSPVEDTPFSWIVLPRQQRQWLRDHAPHLKRYEWIVEARPVAEGIGEVWGHWEFSEGHRFERLTLHFRSVLDPDYLAEKLALGIGAAELKGWRDEDLQGVYEWLGQGLTDVAGSGGIRGQHRAGFLLNAMTCFAISRTEVVTEVRTTLTDTSMDGTPLKADGSF
ncbi:hypothetical protein RKD23_000667 [Streptomyces sp. SAI-170]|uniref:hypothetical protein n=1 Tax=Streptomyces sp. SAI-170 TaxID=3377729 RepID=UPI003C7E2BB4